MPEKKDWKELVDAFTAHHLLPNTSNSIKGKKLTEGEMKLEFDNYWGTHHGGNYRQELSFYNDDDAGKALKPQVLERISKNMRESYISKNLGDTILICLATLFSTFIATWLGIFLYEAIMATSVAPVLVLHLTFLASLGPASVVLAFCGIITAAVLLLYIMVASIIAAATKDHQFEIIPNLSQLPSTAHLSTSTSVTHQQQTQQTNNNLTLLHQTATQTDTVAPSETQTTPNLSQLVSNTSAPSTSTSTTHQQQTQQTNNNLTLLHQTATQTDTAAPSETQTTPNLSQLVSNTSAPSTSTSTTHQQQQQQQQRNNNPHSFRQAGTQTSTAPPNQAQLSYEPFL